MGRSHMIRKMGWKKRDADTLCLVMKVSDYFYGFPYDSGTGTVFIRALILMDSITHLATVVAS
jgi:hypothetical protein